MKKKYIWLIASLLSSMLVAGTFIYQNTIASVTAPTRSEYRNQKDLVKFEPETPAKQQTKYIKSQGKGHSNPVVKVYQLDSGKWKMEAEAESGGEILLDNVMVEGRPLPKQSTVHFVLDFENQNNYPKSNFKLQDGSMREASASQLVGKKVIEAIPTTDRYGYLVENVDFTNESHNKAIIHLEFGYPKYDVRPGTYKIDTAPNGTKKARADYGPEYDLTWWGVYVEAKKIEATANSPMKVGDTQQAKATVDTRSPTATQGGVWGGPKDITSDSKTKWSIVSGDSITISSSGMITAKKKGITKVKVEWTGEDYKLETTIDVGVDTVPTDPGDPGGNTGSGKCYAPSRVGEMNSPTSYMQADPSGVIKADMRGNHMFDVSKGIPTTESLYTNVFATDFIAKYKYSSWQGKCIYPVKVDKTYNRSWTVTVRTGTDSKGNPTYGTETRSDSVPVSKTYQIERPFQFWLIDDYNVWKIKQATAENYALPGELIIMYPKGYQEPNSEHDSKPNWQDHVEDANYSDKTLPSQSLSGSGAPPPVPSEDWTSVAEGQVGRVKVWNDSVKFDNQTTMDNVKVEDKTPNPINHRNPRKIGENVLYELGIEIPAQKLNGWDYPSSGAITYEEYDTLKNLGEKEFPIPDYNSVTIHTPVVNYSKIPDINRPFDQSISPDMSRIAFVLDRGQTLQFPNNGQHRNILGYGNRDYSKYIQMKRIKFPFDMYKDGVFYAGGTWINIPVSETVSNFHIPHWVTEGTYVVRTESWAINAPNFEEGIAEHNANLSLNNYGAFETFNVKILGRVYDFRVYDIGDLRFESVFRSGKSFTGWQYYSGSADRDGNANSVSGQSIKQLPVRIGSHPSEKGTVSHNGYPFLFFLNTMGNVWNSNEGIRITPKFYFQDKKGNNLGEVDLYYNNEKNKLIKVGSALDEKSYTRIVKMSDPLKNINDQFLVHAATFEYNNLLSADYVSKTSLEKHIKNYAKRKVDNGKGYKDLLFDFRLRTLVGPTNEPQVNSETQRRAIQRWFGEYNLPIAPYVVKTGTNLEQIVRTKYSGKISGKEKEFLKDGYILVHFDIVTYRGDNTRGIFAYDASPYGMANMWQIEKQLISSSNYLGINYNFGYGDIIMFESKYSVRDDYGVKGW